MGIASGPVVPGPGAAQATAFDEATAVTPAVEGCHDVRLGERFSFDGSAGRLAAQSRQIARVGRGA